MMVNWRKKPDMKVLIAGIGYVGFSSEKIACSETFPSCFRNPITAS